MTRKKAADTVLRNPREDHKEFHRKQAPDNRAMAEVHTPALFEDLPALLEDQPSEAAPGAPIAEPGHKKSRR